GLRGSPVGDRNRQTLPCKTFAGSETNFFPGLSNRWLQHWHISCCLKQDWREYGRERGQAPSKPGSMEGRKTMHAMSRRSLLTVAIAAGVLVIGPAYPALAEDVQVMLSGSQEVPPVTSSGSGSGMISIRDDKTVSGSVTTTGVTGTMAHIHNGAAGKNGPVVIPLTKTGDNGWAVPPGAKLTDAQYTAFKAGDLYVNVHSAQHQGGEIRGQLKP